MTPEVFKGRVLPGGLLVLDRPKDYAHRVRRLAGTFVEVSIRKARAKRSLSQNAYWWAVPVKLLAEHCGYTENQMHYALLGECFGYQPGPNGLAAPVKPSSADLSVEEFTKLIDWVLVWAPSELGCVLPSPNDWQAAQ